MKGVERVGSSITSQLFQTQNHACSIESGRSVIKKYNVYAVSAVVKAEEEEILELFSTELMARRYLTEVQKVYGRIGRIETIRVNEQYPASAIDGWECQVFIEDGDMIGPYAKTRLMGPLSSAVYMDEVKSSLSIGKRNKRVAVAFSSISSGEAEKLAVAERYRCLQEIGLL